MKSETYDGPLRELRLGRLQHRSIELRLGHFSRHISTFSWPLYASRLVRHRNVRPSLRHHPSTAELARDYTQHRLGLLQLIGSTRAFPASHGGTELDRNRMEPE